MAYLRSAEEPIAMAQRNRLGGRSDGQVSQVHPSLTTAQNHDVLFNSKLLSLLELGRVDHSGDVGDAFNNWDVGCNMKTRADSDGVTCPLRRVNFTVLEELDNVSTNFWVRTDTLDSS